MAAPRHGPVSRARSKATVRARIGVLTGYAAGDPEGQARVGAFRHAVRELGWIESRNVWIDVRWAAADPDLLRTYAAELVGMTPDVILVNNPQGVTAVQRERRNIAIVFAGVSDPVGLHFVDSLARPGGNVTGFTTFEFSPVAKLLEALKEITPGVTRVALIFDPDNPSSAGHLRSLETAAPSFAVDSIAAAIHNPAEIERAIEAFAGERNGGLLVPPNTTLTSHRDLIVASAARYRLPAVYPFRVFVAAGGLMSYGADRVPGMSTVYSKALSQPICLCSSRVSSSWSLISKPPRRSAWRCHRRCSRAPTR